MNWFTKKPAPGRSLEELTRANNEKYGNYDYDQDARFIDRLFEYMLMASVGSLNYRNVLVCGANSGNEIDLLKTFYPDARFTAVDISTAALKKLKANFEEVEIVHANMEELPFKDDEFDVYINCRAIHSSNVSMDRAIEEAKRVTNDLIMLSIANGYLIDGVIVNGMYDYNTEKINKRLPYKYLHYAMSRFNQTTYNLSHIFAEAEIFLTVRPK